MPVQYTPPIYPVPEGIHLSEKTKNAKPCPTCSRKMLLSKKKLVKLSTYALREIARVNIEEKRPATFKDMEAFANWHPEIKNRRSSFTNNYAKLKYWGFIESIKLDQSEDSEEEEDDTKLGWKVTPEGVEFLNGKITAPEILWVFDDVVRENPGKPMNFIHIMEAKDSGRTSRKIEAMESGILEANKV